MVSGTAASFDVGNSQDNQVLPFQGKFADSMAAQEPGQPSLANLSEDVILYLMDFIQDVSPRSVRNLAMVCSYLHAKARYIQHRHVAVDFSKPDPADSQSTKYLQFLSRSGLLPAVRSLQMRYYEYERSPGAGLVLLKEFLPSMTGLHELEWIGVKMPNLIFNILKKHPRIRLRARLASYNAHDASLPFLIASLCGNLNLVALDILGTYIAAKDCLEITQPLKKLLLSCPNLRDLSLQISQSSGCVMHSVPHEYCGLGFTNGERLPPLKSLRIKRYPWGSSPEESQGARWQIPFSEGYPGQGREIDYWVNTFDWSKLRRLHSNSTDIAEKLMPKLTALKEIDIDEWGSRKPVPMAIFFENVPSMLELIKIPSLNSVGTSPLLRHGTHLRTLEIHQLERYNRNWDEGAMKGLDLVKLRDGLPCLEELAIDVSRNEGDWPHDVLDILASFPRLRSLELWFELGLSNRKNPPPVPYLNFAAASWIFQQLRERSRLQPAALQHLHVHSGAPPPLGGGLYSYDAHWPEQNSTSFVCRVSERDVDAARGMFDVECPKLDRKQNELLARIARGVEEQSSPEMNQTAFKVALNGPLEMEEWKRGHRHW